MQTQSQLESMLEYWQGKNSEARITFPVNLQVANDKKVTGADGNIKKIATAVRVEFSDAVWREACKGLVGENAPFAVLRMGTKKDSEYYGSLVLMPTDRSDLGATVKTYKNGRHGIVLKVDGGLYQFLSGTGNWRVAEKPAVANITYTMLPFIAKDGKTQLNALRLNGTAKAA